MQHPAEPEFSHTIKLALKVLTGMMRGIPPGICNVLSLFRAVSQPY